MPEPTAGAPARDLRVDGRRLLLDGEPVLLQGVSFFNAVYNPTFNAGEEQRRYWLATFREYGVNLLRVWCQWDFGRSHPFVDAAPGHSLYTADGDLRPASLATLTAILAAAREQGMVVEVVLFSHETGRARYLPTAQQRRAAGLVAEALRPFRNLICQIWNEESVDVAGTFEAIKRVDPDRIVTNSPGGAGTLGDAEQNTLLDILTPHTQRHSTEPFHRVAACQVADLLARYGKPVIDDEPARNGLVSHGGIEGGTRPEWHLAQIRAVRAAGGHHVYHHDMFQNGAGHPATPPSGIPEPTFSPFHRQVFEFLRANPPVRVAR